MGRCSIESVKPSDRSRLKKANGVLSPLVADRLKQFDRITTQAIDLFEDRQRAISWLSTPKVSLGGIAPLAALSTPLSPIFYPLMITGLILGWTKTTTNQWFPVERMTWQDGIYTTYYLRGYLAANNYHPSERMPEQRAMDLFTKVSVTNSIHPHFHGKLELNRPFDDKHRLARLGLSTDLKQFNAIEYAARSGGYTIDNHDLTAEVTPDDRNIYHYYFGTHHIEGLDVSEYLQSAVTIGDKLELKDNYLYHQGTLVGAASGYVADLYRSHPEAIELHVDLVTPDVYKFHQVLCHVKFDGNIATPFTSEYYQPLATVLAGVN